MCYAMLCSNRSVCAALCIIISLCLCACTGDSWFASVRTAELLRQNGLFFIGDVKTGHARYPEKEIKASTPQDPGAWATFVSKIKARGDELVPIFAVSHRRGESVHTFISTCSTTLKGNSVVAYFEDDEERCNAEISDFELTRKAARVHNDFTKAQPVADRHNRYRQVSASFFLLAAFPATLVAPFLTCVCCVCADRRSTSSPWRSAS